MILRTISNIKLKRLAHKVNEECFKNKLNLKGIKFEFDSTIDKYSCLGLLNYSEYTDRKREFKPNAILFNANFKWDELYLKSVMAHELIHLYEIQILKKKAAHREEFRNEMIRINNMNKGYKVERIWNNLSMKRKAKLWGFYVLFSME